MEKKYIIASKTAEYCDNTGKEVIVLRLPIGHSELNTIELIWAQAKGEVARKTIKFNITSVKELMKTALGNVTPQNWKNAIRHVQKVEADFRKIYFGDESTAPQVETLVIIVTCDDEDDDDDTDDTNSEPESCGESNIEVF